ncbi:MAG TPA: carbohydrate kinase [Ilumatobacteraceae bacterium]|nr:carbohydrate kinase [Ilumatobacteraceae bacterium]
MIVVGGEALVDLIIDRDGGVTAVLGGGPFNTARAIARLGSPVSFLGSLSRDRFGALLLQRLVADGVDDRLVQFTDLPTTMAAAELDEHGSARYRFYAAETSAPALQPASLPPDLTALHVGTLGLVLEPMATNLEATLAGVGVDAFVVIDANCRPAATPDSGAFTARLLRLMSRADVVKASTEDLEVLGSGDADAGLELLRSRSAAVVLHTDGARRVSVHGSEGTVEVAVPRVDVVDTIGAGDAFGGAFVAWWDQAGLGRVDLADLDRVAHAVTAAVEVASLNCMRVGADPPSRADLGDRWRPARR